MQNMPAIIVAGNVFYSSHLNPAIDPFAPYESVRSGVRQHIFFQILSAPK